MATIQEQATQLKSQLPASCKDFHNSNAWTKAYNLYNEANPKKKVRPGCSSCCQTVLNWINKQ